MYIYVIYSYVLIYLKSKYIHMYPQTEIYMCPYLKYEYKNSIYVCIYITHILSM